MTRRTRWLALVALVAALLGCTTTPPIACNASAQCPGFQVCMAGACGFPPDSPFGEAGFALDGGID